MARSIFDCIDGHTCGNPVRVVKTGHPPLVGKTMSEKRQHFIQEYDWIRKGLMFEPRGHDMMSGSFLYPSHNPENDFAILFLETSGALPMCGHGTIGTITIGIEEGLIQPKIPGKIRMEAPAGLVEIDYKQTNGKVEWVKLTNVKSYLAAENLTVHCPDLGDIIFDVAYGGNFYAIIDPQQNFSGIQDFTASIKKNIEEVYADDSKITEELVNRYHKMALRVGNRKAFIDRAKTDFGLDSVENINKLKTIMTPTLLIWGAQDLWIPLANGIRMDRILVNSTLKVLENSGHVPMEENPKESLKLMRDFLN